MTEHVPLNFLECVNAIENTIKSLLYNYAENT